MNRLLTLATALTLLAAATPAAALGLEWGVRGGTGAAVSEDAPGAADGPFAVGPALRLGLGVVSLEANALWHRGAAQVQPGAPATVDRLALPLLAKLEFPLLPGVVSLGFGAGIEPRWLMGAEVRGQDVQDELTDRTLYLPVAAGLDLDLQVATANLEVRYAHQLEPDLVGSQDPNHEVMLMLGLFF